MAGHGGLRPGAGRPQGGISETRRLLLRGLTRGLAHAGRIKHGLHGEDEEVAVETVAMIASDLIRAGQGRDVLAIYAQAAPKSDEGEEGGKKSALVRALERLPGMVDVPERSLSPLAASSEALEMQPSATRPTDYTSVTPYFTPQVALPLPPYLEPPLAVSRDDRALDPDAREASPAARVPPTPGVPTTPMDIRVNAENFEKNRDTPP